MPISDVQLISRHRTSSATSSPTAVSLEVGSIAANLSFIDRPLKKAGLPELKRFFESDGKTWWRTAEVVTAFESARAFYSDAPLDEILFEVVADPLGPAIDVLQAVPDDSVVRFEVIRSKPKKTAKSKAARSAASPSGDASRHVEMKLPEHAASAVVEAMSREETKLSFAGFIAQRMNFDATEAIANMRPQHPGWREEWLERRFRFERISDWADGWYLRGVARRAATGDLVRSVRHAEDSTMAG